MDSLKRYAPSGAVEEPAAKRQESVGASPDVPADVATSAPINSLLGVLGAKRIERGIGTPLNPHLGALTFFKLRLAFPRWLDGTPATNTLQKFVETNDVGNVINKSSVLKLTTPEGLEQLGLITREQLDYLRRCPSYQRQAVLADECIGALLKGGEIDLNCLAALPEDCCDCEAFIKGTLDWKLVGMVNEGLIAIDNFKEIRCLDKGRKELATSDCFVKRLREGWAVDVQALSSLPLVVQNMPIPSSVICRLATPTARQ